MRVWDLDSGAPVHILAGHDGPVGAVAVSADGRRAVSGDSGGTVRVWDLATGKHVAPASQRLRRLFARSPTPGILTLSISADGRRAVSGDGGGTVRVWDLATGKPGRALGGHDGWVRAVAVAAGGRRAVSGGEDGTVRVWDLDSGIALHTLTGHDRRVSAVAVSTDGRHAISGGGWTVRVWNLVQDSELASFVSDSEITALAVTQRGTRVIAGTSTGSVHLLELCGCE
jgi:WD40 repeat protein